MDRFEAMAAFVVVVQQGSFSAASRKLHMPLASLSRRVSDLESDLGVQLLQRSSRSVALTNSGQQFFESCRAILEDLAEAERTVTGEYHAPRGALVVTAQIAFGRRYVAPLVAEFLATYREVEIELRLTGRFIDLQQENVDIALWVGPLSELPRRRKTTAITIGESPRIVCAAPGYLAERGTPKLLKDIVAHDCLTFSVEPGRRAYLFRVGGEPLKMPVNARLAVNTAGAAVDAALASAGLTQIALHAVADEIADGRLAVVLPGFEPEPLAVLLFHRSGEPAPLKVQAFVDFIVPRLRARLEAMERLARPRA
jgi:DNA-binding transcriptional LysR family regulator